MIEAQWLVNGGHGASLSSRRCRARADQQLLQPLAAPLSGGHQRWALVPMPQPPHRPSRSPLERGPTGGRARQPRGGIALATTQPGRNG
jgi:hypothetical protein